MADSGSGFSAEERAAVKQAAAERRAQAKHRREATNAVSSRSGPSIAAIASSTACTLSSRRWSLLAIFACARRSAAACLIAARSSALKPLPLSAMMPLPVLHDRLTGQDRHGARIDWR